MNNQQQMEERLWDYMDGFSDVEEKSAIEKMLESNLEWKACYRELLDIRQSLQTGSLDSPSLRFSKNVMEEIAKLHIAPASKTYINKRIIWGIAIFFILLIGGFLIYGFGQFDWNASNDWNISPQINKINISQFFNNTWVNVFMMINVVLGLFLLDHYLEKRKTKQV